MTTIGRSNRRSPNALPDGERWLSFLRGYGPSLQIDGMYAESVQKWATKHRLEPLHFEHPEFKQLVDSFRAQQGALTNVILTGTAGDGKTTLCDHVWNTLKGVAVDAPRHDDNYGKLEVQTAEGIRTVHFIFDLTSYTAEKPVPLHGVELDLLNRFARSVRSESPDEVFVIAVNDGRLVQTWDTLPPDSEASGLGQDLEDLLANDKRCRQDLNLTFLNLSRMSTRMLFERALDCLLQRPEWNCLKDDAEDIAFGPTSPLYRNFHLLKDIQVRERLLALAELAEANDLHIPIREIFKLLVNAVIGKREAGEHLADVEDLRAAAEMQTAHETEFFANIFGFNLPERVRVKSIAFQAFGGFQAGQETSNAIDDLILQGEDHPRFSSALGSAEQVDAFRSSAPVFQRLLEAYVDTDDDRGDENGAFLEALSDERRRLFFRLPDNDTAFDPWTLTAFHWAGTYRNGVLGKVRAGLQVSDEIISDLVCGLNRVWTGRLAGRFPRLILSTGLDLTSARVSDVFLYGIELKNPIGPRSIHIGLPDGALVPELRVKVHPSGREVAFRLKLTRFEFLMRVGNGALPNSFSVECNEDVLAFKTQVLSEYQRLIGQGSAPDIRRLQELPNGELGIQGARLR